MKRAVTWLDDLRAKTGDEKLSSASQRQCFNLLSRFFSWAIERGHCEVNSCRMIPTGSKTRPRGAVEKHRTWIQDENLARTIYHRLPSPLDVVFLLGYVSGARPGEVCGLRISDCEWLEEGTVRLRYSRSGPLKESKDGTKVKWAPVSADCAALLRSLVTIRTNAGAQGEDFVFANPDGSCISKMQLSRAWRELQQPKDKNRKVLELPAGLDWYGATRHSWVTRQLQAGESRDAVSDAVGHADPRITMKHYAHVVRRTFPESMRRGLGVAPNTGDVLPFKAHA